MRNNKTPHYGDLEGTLFLRACCLVVVLNCVAVAYDVEWQNTDAPLPNGVHYASAVNFDGYVFTVGGCLDTSCSTLSTDVAAFDVGMETDNLMLSVSGVAGTFSSVTVRRHLQSTSSIAIMRSCSMCFLVNSQLVPMSSGPPYANFNSSQYYGSSWGIHINSTVARGTQGRYWVEENSLSMNRPRCNASCLAHGSFVYVIGGIDIETGEEVLTIDAINWTSQTQISNVTQISNDIGVYRRASVSTPDVNIMGTSYVCSLGSTAPVGVAVSSGLMYISSSCIDYAYPELGTKAIVTAWAPQVVPNQMFQLFANSTLAPAETGSTTAAVIPFGSELIVTGGLLAVGTYFYFSNQSDRTQPGPIGRTTTLTMSASNEFGHATFAVEIILSGSGAACSIYSFGGLTAFDTPSTIVQMGQLSLAVAGPIEVIVSAAWSPENGFVGNTTYSQGDFASVAILVGQYLTVRMTSAYNGVVMLSPYADCANALMGTQPIALSGSEFTVHVLTETSELYLCVSDGINIYAGMNAQGFVESVNIFLATNAPAPMRVISASSTSTTSPITSSPTTMPLSTTTTTQTPVTTTAQPSSWSPNTTTAAPRSSSELPTWLPLWAAIVGGVGVLLFAFMIVFCLRRMWYNVRRVSFPNVSHRELIALENITNSNKYTVVRRLGSGGNGEVFLVKRKKDGELCAIKHVRCRGNKTREDLFRESDVLDRLKGHPNMVEILEMSLHEVYIEEDDLDDDDDEYSDEDGTYAVSEQTDASKKLLSGQTSDTKRRRRRRSNLSLLGGESIASTGPMGSEKVAAINVSLGAAAGGATIVDTDAERFAGPGVTTGSDGDGINGKATFLQVRKRKMRGKKKSKDTLCDEAISSSTASKIFVPEESGEDAVAHRGGSELSSGVEEGLKRPSQRRLIADTAQPQAPTPPMKHSESDISASSYYQSINGEGGQIGGGGGRRVRYQCIVMKYFKKGDLATFIEQQLAPATGRLQGERRGSLFSNLLGKKSHSRDDMSSLAFTPGKNSKYLLGDEEVAHSSKRSRGGGGVAEPPSPPASTKDRATPEGGTSRLDVRSLPAGGAGGGGSDSDDPSIPSRNASDDDRNVAPTAEPTRKLNRQTSESNFSHISYGAGRGANASPPLREDVVASIIYQVAALLRYLHSRKPNRIVHCDIKPENILVADTVHPLYLQLLGGQAANAMHSSNSSVSGRSPSRLFARYLNNSSYGGTTGDAKMPSATQSFNTTRNNKSKNSQTRSHEPQSSPYFIGQSQKSSLPSTPMTVNGQVTPIGETIAAALEDVFLPIVVSDVGQAMEVPFQDVGVPPLAPGQAAAANTPNAAAVPAISPFGATVRLAQCTMPYVAPECIASGLRCVTPAIDIWALGCVLYSICTRKLKHTEVVVMFEEVRKSTFADDIRFELCDVLGYSSSLVSLMLAMLNPDPVLRPSAAEITNQWMTFVPHLGQSILPGVMKIHVTTPGAHSNMGSHHLPSSASKRGPQNIPSLSYVSSM